MHHMDQFILNGNTVFDTLLDTPTKLAAWNKKQAELQAWFSNYSNATQTPDTPASVEENMRGIESGLNQTKQSFNEARTELLQLVERKQELEYNISAMLKKTDPTTFYTIEAREVIGQKDAWLPEFKDPVQRVPAGECIPHELLDPDALFSQYGRREYIGRGNPADMGNYMTMPTAPTECIPCVSERREPCEVTRRKHHGARSEHYKTPTQKLPPYKVEGAYTLKFTTVISCIYYGKQGVFTYNAETGGEYTPPDNCHGGYKIEYQRPEYLLSENQRILQQYEKNLETCEHDIELTKGTLDTLKAAISSMMLQYTSTLSLKAIGAMNMASAAYQARLETSKIKMMELNNTQEAIQRLHAVYNATLLGFHGNRSSYQTIQTFMRVIGLNESSYTQFLQRYRAVLTQLNITALDDNITRCHTPEEDVCFWEEGPKTFGFQGAHAASGELSCFPKPVLPLEAVWDPVVRRDPRTGAPIFQVAFVQDEKPRASLRFYGMPRPCIAPNGETNILEETGDTHLIPQEVCPFTLPHWSDPFVTGMEEGARRGVAKVLSKTVPEQAQTCAEHLLYYSLYFAMQVRTDSAYEACFKTLQIAAIALAFTLLHWLAKQTGDPGLTKTARALTFFVPLGYTGYQQGLRAVGDTFIHMFTAMATQVVVETGLPRPRLRGGDEAQPRNDGAARNDAAPNNDGERRQYAN